MAARLPPNAGKPLTENAARGALSVALSNLIWKSADNELFRLASALETLRLHYRMTYQALLGHAVLNDFIAALSNEVDRRIDKQVATAKKDI